MLQQKQTYTQVWQECLGLIRKHTSEEEYVKWFAPIMPIDFDGSTLRLGVPDKSYMQEIEKKYISLLRPIIAQLYGQNTRLYYAVPKSEQASGAVATAKLNVSNSQQFRNQTSTADIKNPFVIPGLRKLNIDPNLNARYTFDKFVDGSCNKLAVSAGKAVAQSPGTNAFNPLYIYGNSGLGKTHIVQAIGHQVRESHPELQVMYVSMNKFQAQFQTAYKNGEIPDFIHFYQTIDVLIIDDIQELTGKTGTQNAFFNIFNHLHLSGKQIIMASDKPPVELRDIEQRLLTRFKWGFATQVNEPDYDTKRKIISVKSPLPIPSDVVDYMACNITSNVREIEGALASMDANVAYLNRRITIPLAKDILKIYIKMTNREVTIDHILKVVAEYMNVTVDDIESKSRTREIALARQTAMYLAKKYTKHSLSIIGSEIGSRNHATVLHSCKAITNLIEVDDEFKKQIDELELVIKG